MHSVVVPPVLHGPRQLCGAEGVHLGYGCDPAHEIVVSWATVSPEPPGRHSRRPFARLFAQDGRQLAAPTSTMTVGQLGDGDWLLMHHAAFTNVSPDTAYRFELAASGMAPHTGHCRTAPAGPASFRFTACGDIGLPCGPGVASGQASAFAERLVVEVERRDPLFHLALGDLAYSNLSCDPTAAWRAFLANVGVSASRRPWLACPGNHELDADGGPARFAAAFGRVADLFVAFTVGNVRFLLLDNNDVCYQDGGSAYRRGSSGGRQRRWLEAQLAAARYGGDVDWIVVGMHQTVVSTADHNGADLGLREEWLPLFDRYDVDLVLAGHEHGYERSHGLRGTVAASPLLRPEVVAQVPPGSSLLASGATVHVVAGGGGAETARGWLTDRSGRPLGLVIVGVDQPGIGGSPLKATEPAPWSAVRGDLAARPYGLVTVDVSPPDGRGLTSLVVSAHGYDGAADDAGMLIDRFTLQRPARRARVRAGFARRPSS